MKYLTIYFNEKNDIFHKSLEIKLDCQIDILIHDVCILCILCLRKYIESY